MAQGSTPEQALSLLDWKRRVLQLYAGIRADDDPERAWGRWLRTRDELFGSHPQSPLPEPERARFEGLDYFAYDPAARVLAEVTATEPKRYEIGTSGNGGDGPTPSPASARPASSWGAST